MIIREARERPLPWSERKRTVPAWTLPFFAVESVWEWLAFALSRWSFLEVLEYMGSLSILVAVFFYFHDADNRVKQRHYQAWQVINTAQGKGGSGGRIEALQELNNDGVPLVGVDVSGAFLQGVHLGKARLLRSDFSAADVRNSDFKSADLQDSNLRSANFRQADFRLASLLRAQIDDADLRGADLSGADLSGTVLDNTDLCYSRLAGVSWKNISSLKGTNLFGAREAPPGFIEWALKNGAVQINREP
ncbi:MAG: pentapeptide repeat-containing protein [Acidobacteria bacterium]|nr:pentapeptide repeat-containing protein [Acidobacteriota bacterium]MBV9147672.1 pentapeptide repeat-containing protein [Acidobacteriota bacterium]MBV9438301.1 pentapeptide repeat-containing protein [Acidobacteriota bacterium]